MIRENVKYEIVYIDNETLLIADRKKSKYEEKAFDLDELEDLISVKEKPEKDKEIDKSGARIWWRYKKKINR